MYNFILRALHKKQKDASPEASSAIPALPLHDVTISSCVLLFIGRLLYKMFYQRILALIA